MANGRLGAGNTGIAAAIGLMLPRFWPRIHKRKHEVARALPDALALTIGVEAGLAFESAMLRVGERWDALTHEFRRAVAEMRVGNTRGALRRMVERTGVPGRNLCGRAHPAAELGVSIAEVLHCRRVDAHQAPPTRRGVARQAGV